MAGKNDNPPPLPHEVFARVLRVAVIDGRLLLFLAGTFALLAAASRDVTGALAGCLAAGAGALEIHGVNRLKQMDLRGVNTLVGSQLLLMATILGYVALRLYDPERVTQMVTSAINHEVREKFAAQGLGEEQIADLLKRFYRATLYILGSVTVFYQGGMALYYHRRRETVRRALEGQG